MNKIKNLVGTFKLLHLFFAVVAFVMLAIFLSRGLIVPGLVLFTIASLLINGAAKPRSVWGASFQAVTLSVPEMLADVLDAFKSQTPALFGPNGFGRDFSSKTAVLGDTIIAKIAKLPTIGSYDRAGGGFKNATQDVTTLFEDVPVTLNQFPIVTVNVSYLTQLASKIPLYKEAVRNYGYVLGKRVIDLALQTVTANNFSNSVSVALANVNLDTVDGSIRDQCNSQKINGTGRILTCGSAFASKLGADDRVRSALFYDSRNGANGYRMWQNVGGFALIQEYVDFPTTGNLIAFAQDSRAIAVATRQPDFANVAADLGIPQVMQFYPISDPETGIFMTGAAWQEAGTGDVYVSCGILMGVAGGKQGGTAGTITDNAGVRIVTP